MNRSWLRIAHRGASGSAPELTRAAFERALALGVDMIELDVQFSRDLELVVIHDYDLQRTTSGSGLVREHCFTELRSLDAGGWFGESFAGQRILSLDEVVRVVGGRARLNVEVKTPAADWPEMATRLVRLLRDHSLMDSAVVSCFEPGALMAVREQASEARLGLLWQRTDFAEAWQAAAALDAVSIHPHWMLVSADVVAVAHQRGLQVLAWTVNDVEVMLDLVRREVDGIISDFPERFEQVADR
jgi:glycerophosphoryl diester phosphodiesterase